MISIKSVKKIIDLRSDTVTKPSPEMWEAVKSIANDDSRLGDDVYREDEYVNELEEKIAQISGKDAGLFVTSGSQANLIALLSNTRPGDEFLVESMSHIYLYEVGSAARIGGLSPRPYFTSNGVAKISDLQSLIRDRDDDHQAWTTLMTFENTHNSHGGTIIPPEYIQKLRDFCNFNDLKLHMDGARLLDSVVGSKRKLREFTDPVDSFMICLSKGLSCPVGSLVVGSKEFIQKGRKYRKMLGGGMRQAGILAAMGLVALEDKWIKRLEEDHRNAKILADKLKNLSDDFSISTPETNMVMVYCPEKTPLDKIYSELKNKGILFGYHGTTIRFVTHYGINEEDIQFFADNFLISLNNF